MGGKIMKKTKIVCTIGPSSEKEEVLRELIINGMNVARLNFSHGSH
jgi:pyruvate kinase